MTYRSVGAEEYLEAIYQLAEMGKEATTTRLADWLGVAPPSVSDMVRRLGEQGLVAYRPYRPIKLEKEGCIRASRLLRRQRLWEVFLYEHLNVPWHRIFEEACSLEHGTSALTESHLERFLDHPAFCPHGYPIPDVSTHVTVLAGRLLSDLIAGERGMVRRIPERHGDVLQYLESRGIMPGEEVQVVEKKPEGVMVILVGGDSVTLMRELAQIIVVD